jgi:hypothetical protein
MFFEGWEGASIVVVFFLGDVNNEKVIENEEK